jgi:hypothetical protein
VESLDEQLQTRHHPAQNLAPPVSLHPSPSP